MVCARDWPGEGRETRETRIRARPPPRPLRLPSPWAGVGQGGRGGKAEAPHKEVQSSPDTAACAPAPLKASAPA